MIKIYFKIAWRNLRKNKFYALINIGGLTTGIACCILICLYLTYELSYDRFHINADRLVRVTTEYAINGAVSKIGMTSSMPGPRLSAGLPQIQSYVRILSFEPYAVQYQEKNFVEPHFLFADSTFFEMFTFPLLEGDPQKALDARGKIVITRKMERKYFGDQRALGKVLKIGGTDPYVISGVAADPPANSQIKFEFVASYASLPMANTPRWESEVYATYFLLRDAGDMPSLARAIRPFMFAQKDIVQTPGDYLTYNLEPITRVHLYSPLAGLEPNGNITYIYVLAAIALMILGIASVNYTNLSTAQAAQRIPEIGVRKVLGSAKWPLFWQFLGESLLLNGVAFALAILAAVLLLPWFNGLVERPLELWMLVHPATLALLAGLYVFVSFSSGVYPALILSKVKLIRILKAGFSFSGAGNGLRRSLIVFQFMVSVFLIISTVIIFQQLSFVQHKDLGLVKDHVLVMPVDALMRRDLQPITDALGRVPGVTTVTVGAEAPTHINWDDAMTLSPSSTAEAFPVHAAPTDIHFVQTMGLHLLAGSDFTLSDWRRLYPDGAGGETETSFLLNESAAKALGWKPEQAIGRTLYRSGSKGIVKGVLRDFHFAPLHEAIGPLVIFLDSSYTHIYQMMVKISGRDVPATMQALAEEWRTRVPHRPFQYQFLDDSYNQLYHNERQTAQIFSSFSTLAILLACLGLFALAAYTTVQRAREIGIRKVLGADTWQIVWLLSLDFIRLVAIAALIAFPLAWVSMNSWLQNFAYRIPISWIVFLLAGLSTAALALGVVSFQAIRTAAMSPVKALKAE